MCVGDDSDVIQVDGARVWEPLYEVVSCRLGTAMVIIVGNDLADVRLLMLGRVRSLKFRRVYRRP
jgi:hypothetical protein